MKLASAWKGVFIFIIFSLLSIPAASAAGPLPSDIVHFINNERTSRGLSSLKIDPALSQAAQSRSAVLAGEGRIFHVTAPKDTPWPEIAQVGYNYSFAGENLALGIETPAELTARWMASPTHRENILEEDFEDIGVGVTMGHYEGKVVSYVVSYYGKKKTGSAVASVSQAVPVDSSASSVSAPKTFIVSEAPQVAGSKSASLSSVPSSKPVPVKAIKKAKVVYPVLSSKYTLETLPPAAPDISDAPAPGGEKVRVIERIIALFGSSFRTLMTSVGWI